MSDFIKQRRDELLPPDEVENETYKRRVKDKIAKELQERIEAGLYGEGENKPARDPRYIVSWYWANYINHGLKRKKSKKSKKEQEFDPGEL